MYFFNVKGFMAYAESNDLLFMFFGILIPSIISQKYDNICNIYT